MLQIIRGLCNRTNNPDSSFKTKVFSEHNNSVLTPLCKNLRQYLFTISCEEVTFAKRGFYSKDIEVQQRLENIGNTFLHGYHTAIAIDNLETLVWKLNNVETELRGFAFEGAAMGLALLDYFTPWKHRIETFLTIGAASHVYMVYVGIGWALARIPLSVDRYLAQLNKEVTKNTNNLEIQNSKLRNIHPLFGWLTIDGYGFHQGYFNASRYVRQQIIPREITGYARRVFDQGLGRSLWFVDGADVNRISVTIRSFDDRRQADLWSGVGLACTYAGGVDCAEEEALLLAADIYCPHLAQGAAFAAKARSLAGNSETHTEMTCQVLCKMSAEAASQITDIALKNLPIDGIETVYEVWRQRIQKKFAAV
ncbi:enediyne biosynthesis protein [Dulcicalothrix desertica PCC 7102]|uniref:Enediyne biosynthesis protein n=1 Tax=Dulcicalothrix desertica PCC 7102 TaxID=232991 RepID=A0A3S1CHH8_9CYAN|nr:DUF1702 family protein [Dulcicalothrix desertica]RUT02787.1 enediyne biosynthesis protein [Dulcicalothrix desertica PCC 7102]TWH38979.1 uncharacterized protein DUF1702 [Dulcicalothrix desertica PCC 7102]